MCYKYGISEFTYIVIVIGQLCLKPSDFRIQSKYRKIWIRNNSIFGHFLRSGCYQLKALFVHEVFTCPYFFVMHDKKNQGSFQDISRPRLDNK